MTDTQYSNDRTIDITSKENEEEFYGWVNTLFLYFFTHIFGDEKVYTHMFNEEFSTDPGAQTTLVHMLEIGFLEICEDGRGQHYNITTKGYGYLRTVLEDAYTFIVAQIAKDPASKKNIQ